MIIANLRKLQALGMLISEATVKHNSAGQRTHSLRAVVTNACLIAGTAGMILSVTLLSSTLLPPLKIMMVLVVAVIVVAWLQWRFLVRVYARAQIAIKETLESHELDQAQKAEEELLKTAYLESVKLPKNSFALGQVIAVLGLREETGVSIVGIERDGERILNPGGEEPILEGDILLLLGEKPQLAKAKEKLNPS